MLKEAKSKDLPGALPEDCSPQIFKDAAEAYQGAIA